MGGDVPVKAKDPCPCGSGRALRDCCQPIHRGRAAPSPERLMRSRYSAYALGRVDHLVATTHPDSPHHPGDAEAFRTELKAYCDAVRFTGLEVLEAGSDGDTGHVRFRAHFVGPRGAGVQEEHSRFLKVDGRWLYLDGR